MVQQRNNINVYILFLQLLQRIEHQIRSTAIELTINYHGVHKFLFFRIRFSDRPAICAKENQIFDINV